MNTLNRKHNSELKEAAFGSIWISFLSKLLQCSMISSVLFPLIRSRHQETSRFLGASNSLWDMSAPRMGKYWLQPWSCLRPDRNTWHCGKLHVSARSKPFQTQDTCISLKRKKTQTCFKMSLDSNRPIQKGTENKSWARGSVGRHSPVCRTPQTQSSAPQNQTKPKPKNSDMKWSSYQSRISALGN